ncbi:TetR/AcrR family transcriptional regulator [Nocardia xishanensis]|uniref:TetR/AcrR family transcriptional regulator n=1 Tax=Nocardia xishanensis TaxID=238964 RepID=A0ABW7XCT5_9NOCA
MAPTRASRNASYEQRSMESRQRILDAAVQSLVEDGYAGASTVRIQKLAGVSRGRLLHHFPSRDELLVAAVHHLATVRMAELRSQSADSLTAAYDDPDRIDQAVARMWATFHQPFFWASTELWIAARNNHSLRSALRMSERRLAQSIHNTLDVLFGPVLAARPHYAQTISMLMASMRGAALTYAFDQRRPDRDPHLSQWKEIARALLAGS